MNYRYIVVEGSIGSGKSELSRRLAQYFDALHLTESPERNPFLEQFYLNAAHHGLATELYFLMRRAEAVEMINTEEEKNERIIADFLLEKDQIFVPVVLKGSDQGNEQTLFWQMKRKIMPEYPVPDLVIYLQTSDESAQKRLQKRHDGMLNLFPAGYLGQIQDEYRRFFHLYQNSPLLIANADEMDFINNDDHFEMLLRAMSNMQGSRHYLNLSEG
ncbi:Deoxyguanosine kinase [Neisseria animaloris]|uniref:Deoxyguanosine kinase n=1 Tax=Neisseria animaloris TaxID=326522 RepID=A0A1X3CJ51_9NEIS|nr:deoxynucleoside kinase [Neisseria animaloris]MDO5073514.1 deoxynucleoside kinase [Neisseria animaloris]OSI07534.1 deoxynucleoside kinase [Neisseria animaloris]VEH86950.1 Deoxyguanosine kinase [Neisseria animaloris]VEJ20917.1 Deoxyguanosine kinase [Neisseria animaloris]